MPGRFSELRLRTRRPARRPFAAVRTSGCAGPSLTWCCPPGSQCYGTDGQCLATEQNQIALKLRVSIARRSARCAVSSSGKFHIRRDRGELQQQRQPGVGRGQRGKSGGAVDRPRRRIEAEQAEQREDDADAERQRQFGRQAPRGEIEARALLAGSRSVDVDDVGLDRRRQRQVGADGEARADADRGEVADIAIPSNGTSANSAELSSIA